MRYIIKETQYKRLIEQAEDAAASTDTTTGTVKAAGYGDISRVPGSETDQVAAKTVGQVGQSVELFTDKELRNRYATYQFKSMTNNGGKLDVVLKGTDDFNLTANCSTLPTDSAFSKGNVKYYSKVLSDMATEKCKTL